MWFVEREIIGLLFIIPLNKSLYKNILGVSIRFAALSNNLGTIDAAEYRVGLQPLMTIEETKEYAIHHHCLPTYAN
jgi:hypothetical protein